MNKIYQLVGLVCVLAITSFSMAATKLIVNQGADSCEFELASDTAVSIDPVTGDISAAVTNLEDCMGPPPLPIINNFSRTPASVTPGGVVTFNWNTENAESCAATAGSTLPGWSGGKALQGSQSITINANPGTYSAGLRCTNPAGEVVTAGPLSVTVTDEPTPCELRPPPNGMTRANTAIWNNNSANGRFFNGVFIGDFPGSTASRQYYQEPNKYHAIQFNTGNMPLTASGQIGGSEPQGPWVTKVGPGRKLVSISTCPGDFRADSERPYCTRAAATTGLFIAWGATPQIGRCLLEPNTTYYLNVVYTSSPIGDGNPNWSCDASRPNCGNLINSQSSGW